MVNLSKNYFMRFLLMFRRSSTWVTDESAMSVIIFTASVERRFKTYPMIKTNMPIMTFSSPCPIKPIDERISRILMQI